jgi:hypothetical protein
MWPLRSLGAAAALAAIPFVVAPVLAADVDLSLSGNPFESSVRVPLLPQGERSPGWITPYVSAGATDPSRNVDASILPRRDIETSRATQRMDIGAGLNWNLTDRLQLFGEMGFQRARDQSYSLFGIDGNRDGTYVKGGFTIRIP